MIRSPEKSASMCDVTVPRRAPPPRPRPGPDRRKDTGPRAARAAKRPGAGACRFRLPPLPGGPPRDGTTPAIRPPGTCQLGRSETRCDSDAPPCALAGDAGAYRHNPNDGASTGLFRFRGAGQCCTVVFVMPPHSRRWEAEDSLRSRHRRSGSTSGRCGPNGGRGSSPPPVAPQPHPRFHALILAYLM